MGAKKKTCPNGVSWMAPIRLNRTDCSPSWRSGVDSPKRKMVQKNRRYGARSVFCVSHSNVFIHPARTITEFDIVVFECLMPQKATPCNPQKDKTSRSHLNSAGFSISFWGFNFHQRKGRLDLPLGLLYSPCFGDVKSGRVPGDA